MMAFDDNAIRHVLSGIRTYVHQQTGKAKRIDNPGYEEFQKKLAQYEQDLKKILNNLKNRQRFLNGQRNQWQGDRSESGYRARQSINDREKLNRDLIDLAETTLRELLALPDSQSIDWVAVSQEAEKLTGIINKALTTTQRLQPAFRASPLPNPGPENFLLLIGLLLAYIQTKVKKPPTSE